ncbi:hypothetical protein [Romboutsia sp.]|uniref:hypothetical protein n=1 Tax=Romboutsia sp. TaxID=1965302 RepID=UPI003F2F9283
MNLKQSLLSTIILSIFITGCSSNQISKGNEIKNEAVYQKTMTKVQNDVNEIMNKDYEYVLNNMGEPYCTTYYINSKQINSNEILNEDFKAENMRLIYPKHAEESQIEESAIYIEIKDNKVVDVETYELSDFSVEEENINHGSDIILNRYYNDMSLPLSKKINVDLKKYIGQDKNNIKSIVGEVFPNYEIYDNTNGSEISIYFLSGINKEDGKILGICTQENKIKDIQVISQNNINLIKKYLCQ